jgi:hypothetical protein
MTDSDTPAFTFSEEEIADIKRTLGVTEDGPAEGGESFTQPESTRRRRGRPRKSPLPEESSFEPREQIIEPAKLTRRDEREVSERLANILTGSTGILSMAKDYLAMTEQEAKDIADPLSSYLVRNAETIPIARQVLENYDLAAIVLGVMAYVVRVYHDRSVEVATVRAAGPIKESTLDRISKAQTGGNGREPEQRSDTIVSTPYESGVGLYGPTV